MSLLERVTTFLEGAVEGFHRLRRREIVVEREFHGTKVGPALLGRGGL